MGGAQPSTEAPAHDPLGDVRPAARVERLLEDTWSSRFSGRPRRELFSETGAAVAFLAVAIPLAIAATARGRIDLPLCALLLAVYGTVSRTVRFPVGAGAATPSYLVLAPMLLLLPPGIVPLLVALGLALASLVRFCAGRAGAHEMLFAVPDAWHTIGPALLFGLAGELHGVSRVAVYVAAFASACALDLGSALARESLAGGVAPELQLRVALRTWLLDLCFAPLGFGIGEAARHDLAALLLLVPLSALMILADRDRTARIAQAEQRLAVVAREREQSRTDPLTGLGNRRKLDEALADALTRVTPETPLLLMLFDLDGFKAYNDRFGHPAGDALLVRLTMRLREAVAPLGSAYRLGGDEFCVLMPADASIEERISASAAALAERGVGFEITASYGSATLPAEAASADEALRLADRRMYGDKFARKAMIADLPSVDARRLRPPAHGGSAAAVGR